MPGFHAMPGPDRPDPTIYCFLKVTLLGTNTAFCPSLFISLIRWSGTSGLFWRGSEAISGRSMEDHIISLMLTGAPSGTVRMGQQGLPPTSHICRLVFSRLDSYFAVFPDGAAAAEPASP